MLSSPGQSAATSSMPTGGKSTLVEFDRPGRTLKFVPPRSVWMDCGGGVGVATGVGPPELLPPQFVEDSTRAPIIAKARHRVFVDSEGWQIERSVIEAHYGDVRASSQRVND